MLRPSKSKPARSITRDDEHGNERYSVRRSQDKIYLKTINSEENKTQSQLVTLLTRADADTTGCFASCKDRSSVIARDAVFVIVRRVLFLEALRFKSRPVLQGCLDVFRCHLPFLFGR